MVFTFKIAKGNEGLKVEMFNDNGTDNPDLIG